MLIDRREILTGAVAASGLAASSPSASQVPTPARVAETPPPAQTLGYNQLGFVPGRRPYVIASADGTAVAIDATHRVVFQEDVAPKQGDLGRWVRSAASPFEGSCRFVVGKTGTRTFPVGRAALPGYQALLTRSVGWFELQRCGRTDRGWLGRPCHVDDGIRSDDGRHGDFAGGWHDASDRRKYVGNAALAICALADLPATTGPEAESLAVELRWGNDWLLKMQNPAGFVYSFSQIWPTPAANRLTDDRPGGGDDRTIVVRRNSLASLYLFAAAQARLARWFARRDPPYAARCLQAGRRAYDYATSHFAEMLAQLPAGDPHAVEVSVESDMVATEYRVHGSALLAATDLSKATGDDRYERDGALAVRRLAALQAPAGKTGGGYFFEDYRRARTHSMRAGDPVTLVALADWIEHRTPARAGPARAILTAYVDGWLLPIAARNAFGLLPYACLAEAEAPPEQRWAGRGYRYFKGPPAFQFYSGRTPTILGIATALAKAGRTLRRPDWREAAWRQVDWVLGTNPFGLALVHGVAHTEAPLYTGQALVPWMAGGVLNGICGDEDDRARAPAGRFEDCEYWMPGNAFMVWLLPELLGTGR